MQVPILLSVFVLLFAFTFSDKIITNLLIYKSCYITLKNDESICALLGFKFDNETIALEKIVQPHAAIIGTTKSMLETIVPACLCFFIGSWSDKYGRRPVMLTSLGGYSIGYLIITIVSYISSASPWFILLASIPICLTGGFPAFYTAVICSITDLNVENRGFRLGILEAVVSASFLLGDLACPFVFKACGYFLTFAITNALVFLSFSIILLIVPETIQNPQTEINFGSLIQFSRVRETVQTTIKRREGEDRTLLFLVIGVMIVFLLGTTADGGIFYLYIRNKLHWSLVTYTFYAVLRNIARIVGTIVGCYLLHKLLHIQEVYLILLGFLSTTSSSILQGLATRGWHMYTAGGLKTFSGNILPMARSLVSKIVKSEETGQVFSFIIITQTFVDFVGPPIYLYIYDKTLSNYYYSGVFNFLTAAIFVLGIILLIPIIRILKRRSNAEPYEILHEESGITNEN